ncbi:MAG: phage portal protein [Dehalococcoidia bacterium]|jgi:HK97 family phage portal protein
MAKNIFSRVWRAVKENRSTTSNPSRWFIDWIHGGQDNYTGVSVTEDSALKYTPFWAAVRIISGSLSTLPLITYKKTDDGKERADKHQTYKILHDICNPYIDPMVMIETRQAHALVWGNGYCEIQRDGAGRAIALWPLSPDRTHRRATPDGVPYYEILLPNGGYAYLNDRNVLHIKGLGYDGMTGYNVVDYHKEALGLGIAAKRQGAKLFSNGAIPGGVLEHPGNLSPEAQDRLRAAIEGLHSGLDNAYRIAILEEGMKWNQTTIDPEKAQSLETQKFSVTDVARMFNLPPHMLADLDRATFSNIEHQALEFINYTLSYWVKKWEHECNIKLFQPSEQGNYFVEFLLDAFLRGDTQSRYAAYAVGRQWGWLSVNDIRKKENLNGIGPEGDIYIEPLNMKPAGSESPVNPPAKPDDKIKDDEPEEDARTKALRKALADGCGQIFRRERNAIGVAVKQPDKCYDYLTKFYNESDRFVTKVMRTPVELAAANAGKGKGPQVDDYLRDLCSNMNSRVVVLNTPTGKLSTVLPTIDKTNEWTNRIINDWGQYADGNKAN